MADFKTIIAPDGTQYDVLDQTARDSADSAAADAEAAQNTANAVQTAVNGKKYLSGMTYTASSKSLTFSQETFTVASA